MDAAERWRAHGLLAARRCMSYKTCISSEPPLRMRNAKYMRVGMLTGQGSRSKGLSPDLRSPTAQFTFSRQERNVAVLVARIKARDRLSSKMSR